MIRLRSKKRNRRELAFPTASENKRDEIEHNGSFQRVDTTPGTAFQAGIEDDPVIDRPPAVRTGGEVARVLSILNEIAVEKLRAQAYEGRDAV